MNTDARQRSPTKRRRWGGARLVAVLGGVLFLASGLCAMIAPETFFDAAATTAPALDIPVWTVLSLALLWTGVAQWRHAGTHVSRSESR